MSRSELFQSFGPALELALLKNVHDAIAEDMGNTDWTGLLVPEGKRCRAQLLCRDKAVLLWPSGPDPEAAAAMLNDFFPRLN